MQDDISLPKPITGENSPLTKDEFKNFVQCIRMLTGPITMSVARAVALQQLSHEQFIDMMSKHDRVLARLIGGWLNACAEVQKHLDEREAPAARVVV